MLGHVAVMVQLAMNESKRIKQVVDSRTTLINQLNALAPKVPIKIPNELRVHEQDLRKLKYPFQLLPLKEIMSGCSGNAREALVILPDRLEAGYEATEEEKKLAELYPTWIKTIDLAGAKVVLGQSHTSLEKFSVDPKLYVTDYKVLASLGLGCSEAKN
jgi:hypothetical protein